MTPPPPLDPDAALFLDVDGTLLEIAPRPELVQCRRRCRCCSIAWPPSATARWRWSAAGRIADIDRLFAPWRGAAAGMHGAERRRIDGSLVTQRRQPRRCRGRGWRSTGCGRPAPMRRGECPGVWLEDKGRTLALHYRAAPERGPRSSTLAGALRAARGRLPAADRRQDGGSSCSRGFYGKDGAIAAFMAEPPFRGRVPVFSATTRPTRTGSPRSTGWAACRSGSAGAAADGRGLTPCPR